MKGVHIFSCSRHLIENSNFELIFLNLENSLSITCIKSFSLYYFHIQLQFQNIQTDYLNCKVNVSLSCVPLVNGMIGVPKDNSLISQGKTLLSSST